MTDETEEKDLLDEDFDPAKAKSSPLLDDDLEDEEGVTLDDFQSDTPDEGEELGFYDRIASC